MACSLLTYEGGGIMGIWSEFASEGLLIDKSKPGVIRKVNLEYDGISEL